MSTIGLWKNTQARQEPSLSEDGAALRREPCISKKTNTHDSIVQRDQSDHRLRPERLQSYQLLPRRIVRAQRSFLVAVV